MAMEFFIACAPEDHPVIPGSGGLPEGSLGAARQGQKQRYSCSLFLPGRAGDPPGGPSERAGEASGADQER
jgi:hypothetical protein